MPVDERTFAARVKSWVDALLARRTDLPYGRAEVEESGAGSRKRADLRVYRRGSNSVSLSGELKMPDKPYGRNHLDRGLVEDAHAKASQRGAPFFFSWNVNRFALFETFREQVPFMDRVVFDRPVVNIRSSDELSNPLMVATIQEFWEDLLEEVALYEAGRKQTPELPLDQRFIRRLEAALEEPIQGTLAELNRRRVEIPRFRSDLDTWMRDQGWEISQTGPALADNLERAARLSCYALANRLIFYEVSRRRFRTLPTLAGIQPDSSNELRMTLERRFREAIDISKDYETIFEPVGLGAELPFLSDASSEPWLKLLQEVEQFDFTRLDYDVIGRMYEQLLRPEERRRYGQYFTSPEIVDLINAFCIRNPSDAVLDPASGGGTFLVRAYARKKALAATRGVNRSHQELLSEIYGLDAEPVAAQLSTINLAVRHLADEPNYPRVLRRDFFSVKSGVSVAKLPGMGDAGETEADVILQDLDAVVGNPPYIRQEHLGAEYKERIAALVREEWRERAPKFSGRSDIYVYFFPHAGSLLKQGGYLGFITSVGWLDTDYGFRLQEFLLRNFRIIAIIESQIEKWFEAARVTTAVVIAQKEPDEQSRNINLVRFIRLSRPLAEIYSGQLSGRASHADEAARQEEMSLLRDVIEEISENERNPDWRVRVLSQRDLWEAGVALGRAVAAEDGDDRTASRYAGGKWGQHLRAPDVWFELRDRASDRLVPLHELAIVKRGFTSGNDKFYCVRDVTEKELERTPDPREFRAKWGISRADTANVRIVQDGAGGAHLVEARFLEPEFHSLMEAKRTVIRASDVERKVVNANVPRASIGRTHFGRYVRSAEEQGWHTGSTVAARGRSGAWYDLRLNSAEDRADIFWPMAQQYRHLAVLNVERLPANHNLFDLHVNASIDKRALWAVLNSTVVALSKHQFGRLAGIEGNLKTEVIDVNMMLVPDVRLAGAETVSRLVCAAERIAQRDIKQLPDEFELADRNELDDAALELLGVSDPSERSELRCRIYEAMREDYRHTRALELIAQRDRSGGSAGGASLEEITNDIWTSHAGELGLLTFPRDFIRAGAAVDQFELPHGEVEVGDAMIETGRRLRSGTIRVGGPSGEVLEAGSPSKGRFLQAASECGLSGRVAVPSDDSICDEAAALFRSYERGLETKLVAIAEDWVPDELRRRRIVRRLLSKALNSSEP